MKVKVLFTVAVVGMLMNACKPTEQRPGGIEHVILIGLDGLSGWGLQAAHTPCIDSLMQNGAYTYSVRTILPSVSAPNWTAMMAGVGPEGTGSIDNSWENGALTFPYVAMTPEKKYPTIFRILREQKPDAVIGSIYSWGSIKNFYETDLLDLNEHHSDDAVVAQKSVDFIKAKKPNLMFCYFSDPDNTLHAKGHLSPDYINIIGTLDGYVRKVINAVHEAGIADKTLIMLMSDHGGIYYGHGGNSYEELHVPFIFSGKGVKKNYHIRQQMYVYDMAANVAYALGLTPPQQWTGRPTKAAYEGFDEPANFWPSADVLPSPMLITKEFNETSSYGGIWVDEPAMLNIQARPDTKGDIRYTLDRTKPTASSLKYTAPVALNKPAVVTAKIFGQNGESMAVSGQYRIADTKAGNGLRYTLYHCPDHATMPSSFGGLKPVSQGICYEFGFHTPENRRTMPLNEAIAAYKDRIAVVYDGWIEIDVDNEYDFSVWSTGGSMLYIGNVPIVNNRSNGHSGSAGRIELKKGRHPIRIEFFHNDQATGSILNASYEARGIPRQVIPAEKLFLSK